MSEHQMVETVFGELPLIENLNLDFDLVAHRRGPAIASKHRISTLQFFLDDNTIPIEIQNAAIRAYVEFSWERIAGIFYETAPELEAGD